eukprot:TRINITY_DN636_c4_g1_i1.p1 TRINITY_DN636_c4_g1~~TRINITY_DN636_c4_g1_i1.p1  ORF type:complete len:592 (+),score=161.04 TRINITY_DN636_c4_g1_i1:48-1778(+)
MQFPGPGPFEPGSQEAGNHFKSQLWKLNQEIEGFSRRVTAPSQQPADPSFRSTLGISGLGSPISASGSNNNSGIELQHQVGGLQNTLEQVNGHLQREQLEKVKLQDEVDQLKVRLSAVSHQQQQQSPREDEIREKNEMISNLREEKAVMKEWLDRGVEECRRVADEVQRLRSELTSGDNERGRLAEEKTRLEQMLERVMSEVRDTSLRLEQEKGDKEVAMDQAAEKDRAMVVHDEQLKQTRAECDRLATEVARLIEKARESEEAETHLRVMVSGSKRIAAAFLQLHTAVEQERFSDLVGIDPSHDSTAGSGSVADVALQGKTALSELQDVLLALRSIVRARFEETQNRCIEAARREEFTTKQAMEGALRTEQELRERHAIERRLLEGKLAEMQSELSTLTEAPKFDPTSGEAQLLSQQQHQQPDSVLQARVTKLEQQNAKLKEKKKKLKIDWHKITDIRKANERLEMEKKTMLSYIEGLERELQNHQQRGLNQQQGLYGVGGGGGYPSRGMSPSKRYESEITSQMWKEWKRGASSWTSWQKNHADYNSTPSVNTNSYQTKTRVSPARASGPWMPSP